jgi:hypothetical protein
MLPMDIPKRRDAAQAVYIQAVFELYETFS